MAGGTFNIAKGRIIEKIADAPNNLVVLFLKVAEAKATLEDHATVASLLAAVGNDEADFTNYSRKTGITGTITVGVGEATVDIPNQTFVAAGGATNNTLVKMIVAYQEGASDATLIPLTHHDFNVTTNGNDLPVIIDSAGFFRASEA